MGVRPRCIQAPGTEYWYPYTLVEPLFKGLRIHLSDVVIKRKCGKMRFAVQITTEQLHEMGISCFLDAGIEALISVELSTVKMFFYSLLFFSLVA